MKKSILLATVLFSLIFLGNAFGQKQKTETITIKTSAECEVCKKKIETLLLSEKGVKKATVNIDTKEVLVSYDPRKMPPDKIRFVLSNAGYDADAIPANNKALQRVKESHK